MKPRLLLAPAAALVVFLMLIAAGCGGSSSSSGPASLAPPGTLVFVEGELQPSGQLKADVESIAQKVGGIDDLGQYIVEQLESSAREEGEPLDFEAEIEPWLGERAGLFFESLEDGDLSNGAMVIQSTDTGATQEFVDKQTGSGEDSFEDASYEGVDYTVDTADDTAIAVIGDFMVIGEEAGLKQAVDASNGDSLAGEERFDDAISAAPEGSLADVYVDVGGLIRKSGTDVSEQALQLLKGAGIDPGEATALASLVPGADQIEIDLSGDFGGEEPPSGDASALLGSLPGESFVALAVSGFGEQLQEAIDSLDKSGIPPQVPPNKLKSGLKEAGIDLDEIAASLSDAGLFVVGSSESSLEGAAVFTTEQSGDAAETVDNLGDLLRGVGAPGVSELNGEISGFSVSDPELGSKPLVVAAQGERIAIGYGLPTTTQALSEPQGGVLAGSPAYEAAVASLGDTPISAFVDGAGALRLAESLVPRSETGFWEAQPYLSNIRFLALGSTSDGELATAKLIVGLTE